MEINKKQDGESLVLQCAGRLDTTTAPMLEAELLPAFDESENVVLDFADLIYVSSAGLRVLLKAQKKADAINGSLVLQNISEEIKEVFDMTGFSDILTLE
ncbi:MAG: STAS domain-containing protein [Oscillospiraceae bacterium]|jgi:anti-anti-sigma factor|nr:STAS domain-containing protein [Oscillospiraceae bacterium]